MSKHFTLPATHISIAEKYPLAARTAVILLWLLSFIMVYRLIDAVLQYNSILGQDSHAYWLAGQGELEYSRRPRQEDAYLYSPAFLTLIRPLTMLPWPFFLPVWICLGASLLIWLLRPLHIKWSVPFFLLCLPELVAGNIYIFLAGAAVIGMRKPVAWSFPILTKVTTGVGLLWFAARGDWRGLLQGLGGLSFVVVASYAINPAEWQAWLQFLLEHREETPDSPTSFILRCLLAITLVVIGARKQWPWLIAPAMVLASPVLGAVMPLTILAAIPRLARLPRQDVNRASPRRPDPAETAKTS